jgi:flagellar basal-body rod protein FlgF
MERGLSIAASGMAAEQVRQDLIASDIANASTPGYKADRAALASFGGLLVARASDGQPVGELGAGTRVATIRPDLEQGALKETDEPLDVALQGQGFLTVQTPQGVRYTRNGQLQVDGQGRLTTQSGYAVLDRAGRSIAVRSADSVHIGPDGTVTVAG